MNKTAEVFNAESILEKHCPSMCNLYLDAQGRNFRDRVVKAMIEFAAPPPASEGEMLQAEIKKCNEALMQPNFSIDNYRCYWEGRRALAEELLATLPTREQGGEERRLCSCFKNEVCGVCYESKGYVVADGILGKLPSPPKH